MTKTQKHFIHNTLIDTYENVVTDFSSVSNGDIVYIDGQNIFTNKGLYAIMSDAIIRLWAATTGEDDKEIRVNMSDRLLVTMQETYNSSGLPCLVREDGLVSPHALFARSEKGVVIRDKWNKGKVLAIVPHTPESLNFTLSVWEKGIFGVYSQSDDKLYLCLADEDSIPVSYIRTEAGT